jgi:Flp pilus assembly protein CpaB
MTSMSPRRLHTLLWRLVAGLLALSVAVIVTLLVERRMQALGQPVAALVAREAIPAYTAIRPDDVQVVRLPAAAVAGGALRDPAELEGRLARVEIPPGVPLYRQQVVPASDLRYTTDRRAVILALAVLPAHAPSNLLKPGQRVDVWTDGSIVTGGLRVVAVSSLSDGRLAVAVEAGQDGAAPLLMASGRSDLALTLSPLERLSTPTVLPVTATPTSIPSTVCCPTPTSSPTATASPTATPTPGVAVVKAGPAQGLNVRAGPGTNYPVLATLRAGSRLTPVGRDADGRWVEVCCVADGQSGWVLAELVDLAVDLASLPVR